MDQEAFEGEIGAMLRAEPPAKSVRLIHRADMLTSRDIKKEPPSPQNIPKPAQQEMPIRRALPIQSLAQADSPWEGLTLNRCLFVAITILLISSGLQRLHVALKALRTEEDEGERAEEDEGERELKNGPALGGHAELSRDGTPPQPESSLWDALFWWVLEDEDDEDEEEEEEEEEIADAGETETETKGARRGAGRDRHREPARSAGRKRDQRKEKRGRGRGQEGEETHRRKPKKGGKRERREGSEVTKLTE